MDEKNTLNDERIEEVSGGLDPANNETAQEGLHELKPLIGKDSEEFLEKVSGGDLSGGPLNAFMIYRTWTTTSLCIKNREAAWKQC